MMTTSDTAGWQSTPDPETLAALRRRIEALGRLLAHAAAGMPEDPQGGLRDLVAARDLTDEAITRLVDLRRADGSTWETLGQTLGLTKQGTAQRYGRGRS